MKITVTPKALFGVYKIEFDGHAPNEKYCAAMSTIKEAIEDCAKYYKCGFQMYMNSPYFRIEVNATKDCEEALNALAQTIQRLAKSMNEEYKYSCKYKYNEEDMTNG